MHSAQCAQVGGIIGWSILQSGIAIDQIVESYDALLATIGHYLDTLAVARLEAYGRSGGYVEMTTEGLVALELEIAINLKEVEVRAHLNGAVTRITNGDGGCTATCVILDVGGGQNNATYGHSRIGSEAPA